MNCSVSNFTEQEAVVLGAISARCLVHDYRLGGTGATPPLRLHCRRQACVSAVSCGFQDIVAVPRLSANYLDDESPQFSVEGFAGIYNVGDDESLKMCIESQRSGLPRKGDKGSLGFNVENLIARLVDSNGQVVYKFQHDISLLAFNGNDTKTSGDSILII